MRPTRVRGTVAVWAVGFVVIFWRSWRPAWSADETATVMVIRRSWPRVVRTFSFDSALEPYYLAMRAWSSVSTSHAWLRLPSVLAMSAAIALLWAVIRRHVGARSALVSVAAILAMPATSMYGQLARPYALAVLLVVLMVSTWASIGSVGGWRVKVRLAVLMISAGLLHPYTWAVVPFLVAACFAVPSALRGAFLRVTVTATLLAIAISAPLLAFVAHHAHGQPNPMTLTVRHIVAIAALLPLDLLATPLAGVLTVLVWGVAATGLGLWFAGRSVERRRAVVVGLWLLGPPALLCVVQAVTGAPGLVARYWLFSLPALAVAAGAAFARGGQRVAAAAAAFVVVLAAVAVPSQLAIRSTNGHLGQGWEALPRVLALPLLRRAPLLTGSWNYHGLFANDPAVRARMPLVRDPDPTGRIVPQLVGAASSAFAAVVARTDRVVVLATARDWRNTVPGRQDFRGFRGELRAFPHLAVSCRWFGQALGVFVKPGSALNVADDRALERQIRALSTDNIRCGGPATAMARG